MININLSIHRSALYECAERFMVQFRRIRYFKGVYTNMKYMMFLRTSFIFQSLTCKNSHSFNLHLLIETKILQYFQEEFT